MNAVEIEEAVSELAGAPFDLNEFPFAFLQAFGNKETTIRRLRARSGNASDVPGGVLQRSNIHLAVCTAGAVGDTLRLLRESPKTAANKAKFVLATDGATVEAEELATGEVIACDFARLSDHFGFFLPLAGISTIRQIKNNPIDVKATGRLNRLYVELLKENPNWGTPERRHDLNQFMARLIFCFFAQDTGIFLGQQLFTETVKQMSDAGSGETHKVISALFVAMDTRIEKRPSKGVRPWADKFPYVNGSLFSGSTDCPRFSRIARSYLLRAGELSWRAINPDIFGSMIQAVADDEERGALGLHYTSVPNILKLLNPLVLDDLREKLEEAGDNLRKLLNLRNRMARIRVFDPACGSGNFLVIAYKQMREIEAEINRRRGEPDRASEIPLTNFRGVELRNFPAEIARLALIIAEYQADVLYRGQKLALAEVLPLNQENWITCGNALSLDWLRVCPPTGTGVKLVGDDLFQTPLDQAQIDFENEGGETYICGNPPYLGSVLQSFSQKVELKDIFESYTDSWKSLDYVAGWLFKAALYGLQTNSVAAFVATNSICQGEQVPILWPLIFSFGHRIDFARTSFKWSNLASHNAGVTVVVVGISKVSSRKPKIFNTDEDGSDVIRNAENISPYLVSGASVVVEPASAAPDLRAKMIRGNMPNDGGHLVLTSLEAETLQRDHRCAKSFVRRFVGSKELITASAKYCIWIEDHQLATAMECPPIRERIAKVRAARLSGGTQARGNANTPHKFVFAPHRDGTAIVVPRVSSENRDYLPVGVTDGSFVISERNFALYNAPLWNLALIVSRLHWIWIGTVCVRMRTDFSYSNTLGWHTFPVPPLTMTNKTDLTRCGEDILLAREAHFPATIADLYDPDTMPDDLRRAHEANDETLERIYIGRNFRNDTERLEKLFSMYAETIASAKTTASRPKTRATRKNAT